MSRASDLPAQLYFRVLACVARADNVVHPNEEAFLRTMLHQMDLPREDHEQLEAMLVGSTPLDVRTAIAEAVAWVSPEHLTELLRDAYIVAGMDRDVVLPEVAVIEHLLESMRIQPERRPALHEWARRAAEHHVDGLLLLKNALAQG